jgi:type III secretion protein S
MDSVQGIVQVAQQGLLLIFILSLPVVAVSAIVGLVIGAFQAITQLQDQSLSFAIKFAAVMAVIMLTGAWSAKHLIDLFELSLAAGFK